MWPTEKERQQGSLKRVETLCYIVMLKSQSPWLNIPGIKLSLTTDGGWSLPAPQDLTKQIPLTKKFTLNPL